MSLFEVFIELERKRSSYYYDRVMNIKPITNPDRSWEFIGKYFKYGEKEAILDKKEISDVKKKGKHEHTVSLYFLGISLMRKVEEDMKLKLEDLGIHAREYDFKYPYTWFLTCLFHDYSWNIECEAPKKSYSNKSDLYGKFFDTKYDIYNHLLANEVEYQPNYSMELMNKYFWFKYHKFHQLDHGIIAGHLLFDRLIKNYNNQWEDYKVFGNGEFRSSDYFEHKGKTWRREHWDHFAYIADSIISHNIWMNDGSKVYEEYDLLELSMSSANKIKYVDNPLLFILGVLDTVEPVKFFNNFSAEYIWNNIDYEVRDEGIWMKVNSSSVFNYSEWFKKIKSLEEWIDTRVTIKGREIVIKIPFGRAQIR